MKPILSERDLASRLGIALTRLRQLADEVGKHYIEFPVMKGDKVRIIRPPLDDLKDVQRRIKAKILDRLPLADGAHGGVRGRSPRSNAERHLGQACVINLDVRKFFDNVHHNVVYRLFRKELGFGREVARLLTRLTTLRDRLPQGAPTSTAIANLLLALPVDCPISGEAARIGVCYTRFVDDITFSGPDPRPLINVVGKMLSRRRLPMYRRRARYQPGSKLRITSRRDHQEVTGLVVNSKSGPSVPRTYRDNVRSAIFGLGSIEKTALPSAVRSIRGKIDYVRKFNIGAAERMQRNLAAALASRDVGPEGTPRPVLRKL
jgi:RNA-directed DNA polymerase